MILQTPCHLDSIKQTGLMNTCLCTIGIPGSTHFTKIWQDYAIAFLSSQTRHDTVFMLTVGRWMIPNPAQNLPGCNIFKPI